MITNKRGITRASAGLVLAMGVAFASSPVSAEPLPHDFLYLKMHYLECFGLMFSDPAQHEAECGTAATTSFGQNAGDLAGPGGGSSGGDGCYTIPDSYGPQAFSAVTSGGGDNVIPPCEDN